MTEQNATIVREIVTEIEKLPDDKIVEVMDFVRFLRTQSDSDRTKRHSPRALNETRLAQLYAESSEEDQQLAETGVSDFAASLTGEDSSAKG